MSRLFHLSFALMTVLTASTLSCDSAAPGDGTSTFGEGSGGAGTGGGGTGGAGASGAEARCALPFEIGMCTAAFPRYVSLEGTCVEVIWGGCMGNDNLFETLAACRAACGGPLPSDPCPPTRPAREICIDHNFGEKVTVCARPCAGPEDCESALPACKDGVCQAACR